MQLEVHSTHIVEDRPGDRPENRPGDRPGDRLVVGNPDDKLGCKPEGSNQVEE